MTILDLQKALFEAGFDPGPLDGIAGPKTRAAIRAFQAKNGLEVDGIAGPKTQAKLMGKKAATTTQINKAISYGDIPPDLPWLSEGKRLIGTTEVVGNGSNPTLLDWGKAEGVPYSDDETPWCGLFMAHCIGATLPDEPIPENPLGARNWLKFGQDVPPQFGSVLVFWRGSKTGWMGHVGFYWAEDDTHYQVLGGNQSNAVNVMRIAKGRLLGAQWPNATPPKNIRRHLVGTQIISDDEE